MGFPFKNQTGWRCHILFSASGRLLLISFASKLQITLSPFARALLYACVSLFIATFILYDFTSWLLKQILQWFLLSAETVVLIRLFWPVENLRNQIREQLCNLPGSNHYRPLFSLRATYWLKSWSEEFLLF